MKRLFKIAALTIASSLVGVSAQAVSWGTIQSSLGYSYGDFYNSGNIYARNNDQLEKKDSNNDQVYVNTQFKFYYQGAQVGATLSYNSSKTTSKSYVGDYVRTGLNGSATSVRGVIHVCEDRSFQPDPCSDAQAVPSFSY